MRVGLERLQAKYVLPQLWDDSISNQCQESSGLGGLMWVPQHDTHSCGPLSCAAAIMILQGIRPLVHNIGIRPSGKYNQETMARLRDSMLVLFLLEVQWAMRDVKGPNCLSDPLVDDCLVRWSPHLGGESQPVNT